MIRTDYLRGAIPEGPQPFPCRLNLHNWADWKAHEQPCAREGVTEHAIRQCKRCTQRDHRFTFEETPDTPIPDCGGCTNDPAEYAFCRRWRSGDPACRPKKRTR